MLELSPFTCLAGTLAEPQAKGPFLGLTVYDASKLPPCGLLWESDAAKGGKHDVIRARIDQVGDTRNLTGR